MEDFAFKNYMKNEVVQKTIIFADTLSLKITGYTPSKNPDTPYRMNLYNNDDLVGYIDEVVDEDDSQYIHTELPVVLFTPLGKVTGRFSTHFNNFSYDLENWSKEVANLNGIFKIARTGLYQDQKFAISSYINLETPEGQRLYVSFNRACSTNEVSLDTEGEKATLYCGGDGLSVKHIIYPSHNTPQILTGVYVDLQKKPLATFNFINIPTYTKPITTSDRVLDSWPVTMKAEALDFSEVMSEVDGNDPSLKDFIAKVRNVLTISANGITPFSLYDKMASVCFQGDDEYYKYTFAKAEEMPIAQNTNQTLIRMLNWKPKKK